MSLLRSLSSRCMSALLLVAASAPPRCAIECSSPLTPIYFGRKTHTSAGGSGGARHASPAPLLPHADQGVGSVSLRQPAPSPRHITCRHGYQDPPMTAGHNREMCRTLRSAAAVTEGGAPCHTRPAPSYLRA